MNAVERYLFHLRRWWWLIVVAALLTGLLSLLLAVRSSGSYSATTELQVAFTNTQSSSPAEVILAAERQAGTDAELITTRPILQEAVKRIGGPETVDDLAKQVSAIALTDRPLFTVTATSKDAQRAALIANTLSQVFVDKNAASLPAAQATPAPGETTVAQTQSVVSIVESAETPSSKSGVPVPVQTFAGMIAGASLVLIVLAGRAYFDSSVWSPDDLRAAGINIPCLGVVPDGEIGAGTLLTSGRGIPALTESIRTIATTALSAMSRLEHQDDGCNAVGVVSAMHGEGRTSITARLGVAAAMEGMGVMLVDFDLRHPDLHEQFRIPNGYGITDAMWSRGARTPALSETAIVVLDRLRVVPAGQDPSLPARRLSTTEVSNVIEQLKSNGTEVMFFDTPPLSDGTEAVVLGQVLDAAIVVVEARRTTVEDVVSVTGQMQALGLTVLGYVLNKR